MPEIHKIREKRSPVGLIVRTRDCCDLTRLTLPAVLGEPGTDVYWIDGSVTEEGMARALNDYRDLPGLCEVHTGVTSGQMGSWIYGVRCLVRQQHDYFGSLEGDILLEPGWLQAMLDVYAKGERDGLHVGSVSARCIEDRILVPRDGYAVMGNIGCGMFVMRNDIFMKLVGDASNCVLGNPVFLFSEIYMMFKELAGVEYPINKQLLKDIDGIEIKAGNLYEWNMSNDWWWETILLRQGLVALAPTPSFARNIDEEGGRYCVIERPTVSDHAFDWQSFTARLQRLYENPIITPAPQYQNLSKVGA